MSPVFQGKLGFFRACDHVCLCIPRLLMLLLLKIFYETLVGKRCSVGYSLCST